MFYTFIWNIHDRRRNHISSKQNAFLYLQHLFASPLQSIHSVNLFPFPELSMKFALIQASTKHGRDKNGTLVRGLWYLYSIKKGNKHDLVSESRELEGGGRGFSGYRVRILDQSDRKLTWTPPTPITNSSWLINRDASRLSRAVPASDFRSENRLWMKQEGNRAEMTRLDGVLALAIGCCWRRCWAVKLNLNLK